MQQPTFEDVVGFHGHSCPGLAMGYRVALAAMEKLNLRRAADEDVVAVVENNSCAVDAVQAVTGCTFGKGNLLFCDYGKQVYTFYDRGRGGGVRISVCWAGLPESPEDAAMWRRYLAGDRSAEVTTAVARLRAVKSKAILAAETQDLFRFSEPVQPMPQRARIYPSVICSICGEKVMEPRAVPVEGGMRCIPCDNNSRQRPGDG